MALAALVLAAGAPSLAPSAPIHALGHHQRNSGGSPTAPSDLWGSGLSARKTLLRPELPLLNWGPHLRSAVLSFTVPQPARTSPAHFGRGPQTPGEDLILNGGQTVVISHNTTVRNVNLSGNATLIVHNATAPVVLTVEGSILLQDSSILYLNQSSLVADERYDNQLSITGEDHSLYLVYGANVSSNGFQWIGAFTGDANMTVVGSSYGYPTSWFPAYTSGNASVFIAGSYFLGDLVMQDTVYLPSTAHVVVRDSVGFNVWIGLRQSAAVDVSFPAPLSFQSWQFPGPYTVSNVSYSVNVTGSFVGYHVVSVWPGSNLTIAHSPGVVVALNPIDENVSLDGLAEGWLNTSYDESGFSVRLIDANVVSWNVYAFASNVTVHGGQVGGILASAGSTVQVRDATLTGSGGYYGALSNSTLTIENSSVLGQVTGYQNGALVLQNCTFDPWFPQQVVATARSTILLANSVLGPQTILGARDQGRVVVTEQLSVEVTGSNPTFAAPQVTIDWTGNRSPVASAPTGSSGLARFDLLTSIVLPTGNLSLSNYTVLARQGWSGGSAAIDLSAPSGVLLSLGPLVAATLPQNGSTDVPATTEVTFDFGAPMNTSETDAAIVTVPRTPFAPEWSSDDSVLTLGLPGLSWNASYSVVIGNGAATAAGIAFPGAYVLTFTTAARPALAMPTVLATTEPLNQSTSVSPWTNVTLTFSRPMDASSTLAAFTVNPAVPGQSVVVQGSSVVWTHRIPLAYGTRYTLTVTTRALDTRGVPLAHAYQMVFSTESSSPLTAAHGTSVFPMSLIVGLAVASVVLGSLVVLLASSLVRRRPPTNPYLPALAAIPVLPPPWKED